MLICHWVLEQAPYRISAAQSGRIALAEKPLDIFIGTSHVASAINPLLFQRSATVLATSFLDAHGIQLVVKQLCPSLGQEQRVFLEFGGEFLLMKAGLDSLSYRAHLRDLGVSIDIDPVKWITDFSHSFEDFFPRFFDTRITPRYLMSIPNTLQKNAETLGLRGHSPSQEQYGITNGFESIAVIGGKRAARRSEKDLADNIAKLRESIALLVDHGIRVILVRYPKSKDIDRIQPANADQIYEEVSRALIAEFKGSGKVTLIDLNSAGGWDDTYFRDISHLNSRGAERVAKLLPPAKY
jgi:hypothetical protein